MISIHIRKNCTSLLFLSIPSDGNILVPHFLKLGAILFILFLVLVVVFSMGKLYYKQYFNIKIKSFQAFHKYLDQKFKLDFFNLHVYP